MKDSRFILPIEMWKHKAALENWLSKGFTSCTYSKTAKIGFFSVNRTVVCFNKLNVFQNWFTVGHQSTCKFDTDRTVESWLEIFTVYLANIFMKLWQTSDVTNSLNNDLSEEISAQTVSYLTVTSTETRRTSRKKLAVYNLLIRNGYSGYNKRRILPFPRPIFTS